MATAGYYDEIAKIERLRNDQLERLRSRVRRRGLRSEQAPERPALRLRYVRKLPGRKAWSR